MREKTGSEEFEIVNPRVEHSPPLTRKERRSIERSSLKSSGVKKKYQ